jgi:hypothetical protein
MNLEMDLEMDLKLVLKLVLILKCRIKRLILAKNWMPNQASSLIKHGLHILRAPIQLKLYSSESTANFMQPWHLSFIVAVSSLNDLFISSNSAFFNFTCSVQDNLVGS